MAIQPSQNSGAPNPIPAGSTPETNPVSEKVAFTVLERVKLVWLHILYHIYTFCSDSKTAIFDQATTTIPTHNFAKKEDLAGYVKLKPLDLAHASQLANGYGLYLKDEKAKITPLGEGKCFGAVVHFFESAEKGGVEQAAEAFRGGMPVRAAHYQTLYEEFNETKIQSEMYAYLIKMLEEPGFNEEWPFGRRLIPIFRAVQGYEGSGSGLLEHVKSRVVLGNYYGTIRAVEEHLIGKELQGVDEERFIFNAVGLKSEPLCIDDSPTSIFNQLGNLEAGNYCLSLPTYKSTGGVSGYHATGFVISDDGTFHFLDPNFGVGQIPLEHLKTTIEELFKTYTGVTSFGETTRKRKATWNRFCQFMKHRPNASPKVESGFSLTRVVKAESP